MHNYTPNLFFHVGPWEKENGDGDVRDYVCREGGEGEGGRGINGDRSRVLYGSVLLLGPGTV